jgi:hypothetical protein
MVDVSDGTNVHMRFGTLEFFFGHINLLLGFVNGTHSVSQHENCKDTVRRHDAVDATHNLLVWAFGL